jgi:hypothetical protein
MNDLNDAVGALEDRLARIEARQEAAIFLMLKVMKWAAREDPEWRAQVIRDLKADIEDADGPHATEAAEMILNDFKEET